LTWIKESDRGLWHGTDARAGHFLPANDGNGPIGTAGNRLLVGGKLQEACVSRIALPPNRRSDGQGVCAGDSSAGEAAGLKSTGQKNLRVLFACSEIFPLAKTGGLADVSAALPEAPARLGQIYSPHDVGRCRERPQ
jgi:hypothetical protein